MELPGTFSPTKPAAGTSEAVVHPAEADTDDAPPEAEAATPAENAILDAAALLRQHLHATTPTASGLADSAQGQGTRGTGVGQQWRTRLSELGQAAGLSERQESELERLARAQVDHIREEIPRLLNELKPHFDTPAEAEAKQRYEAGLKALRARLDRETLALLDSLGLERASG